MKYFTKLRPISDAQARETLALPKILALGDRQIEEGKVASAAEVFRRLRDKLSRS